MRCESCGYEFADETVEFCPQCGARRPVSAGGEEQGEKGKPQRFCPQCGAAVEPNAAFCPACGYKLQNGGAGADTVARVKEQSLSLLNKLWDYIKAYFHDPVGASRNLISGNGKSVVITLLVVYALLSGFQLLASIGVGVGLAEDILMWTSAGVKVSAPFFMSMLCGIIMAAVWVALFSLIYFITARIIKEPCSFKDGIYACAANSLLPMVLMLLTIIGLQLSLWIGVFCAAAVQISWYVMGMAGLMSVRPRTEKGGLWLTYLIGLIVAVVLSTVITWNLSLWAIKEVSFSDGNVSYTINDMMKMGALGDAGDVLDEILGGIL